MHTTRHPTIAIELLSCNGRPLVRYTPTRRGEAGQNWHRSVRFGERGQALALRHAIPQGHKLQCFLLIYQKIRDHSLWSAIIRVAGDSVSYACTRGLTLA
jgi:hypothetical protein